MIFQVIKVIFFSIINIIGILCKKLLNYETNYFFDSSELVPVNYINHTVEMMRLGLYEKTTGIESSLLEKEEFYGNIREEEINKDKEDLRKFHEDWANRNIKDREKFKQIIEKYKQKD